jgi:predicted HD phosphohydrolase
MKGPRVFTEVAELIEHLAWSDTLGSVEGDGLTELDHGLQTAALLQQTHPHDVEVQIAGLVHDLAHPWDGPGQPRHAGMGARSVRQLLGSRVADLIVSHVPAKRYLVATRPEYASLLSPDSVMTLHAQGGAMSADEVTAFEAQPDLDARVALRVADDRAKVPGAVVPGLDHWLDALRAVAAKAHFDRHGWVLLDTLDDGEVAQVRSWIDEIAATADGVNGVLHYREQTDHGEQLCRSENFTPSHTGLGHLLCERLATTASLLLGEPAVLYKEKINYKLVGGAGYSPHQDAPAYPFIDTHVSCMVAVDDATVANGCLEVVSGRHDAVLPMDDRGCIAPDAVASMTWVPAEVKAGQTLWFHSRTPHRSGPNLSDRDRRALYPTYNAAREGDLRDQYYRTKLAELADRDGGGRVVVSLIGDFEGRPVNRS